MLNWQLHIKTHKCNSLMNNRRIVIVNVVKIIQKLQAWPTWWIKTAMSELFGFMNSRHFCHNEDVQNNRSSALKILVRTMAKLKELSNRSRCKKSLSHQKFYNFGWLHIINNICMWLHKGLFPSFSYLFLHEFAKLGRPAA